MFARHPVVPAVLAAFAALFALDAAAAPSVKTEHVEAELVADKSSAQPGKPALVGLKLRMTPEWHTYWKNPGDSGLPTKIQWILPEGWKAGEIQWPYPQPIPVGPLMNYGYEDEVVLLSELTPPADAKPGPASVKAKADWLVCKDVCVPEKGELDIVIPVSPGDAAPNPRAQIAIARARNQLPVAAPGWKYEAALQGKSLVVRLTPPVGVDAPAKVALFPEREGLIEPAAAQKVTREGRALRIEAKLAEPALAGMKEVKAVAVSQEGWPGTDRRKAIGFAAPLGDSLGAAGVTTSPGGGGAAGILAALALAFMGGVLLNLMPCV